MSDLRDVTSTNNSETSMSDSTLWCMHFIGADEVYAAPSFEEADQGARWCNWRFNQDPKMADMPARFVVAVWPHSAEGHAASVKRWHDEWHPRGPADAPGATVGFGPLPAPE